MKLRDSVHCALWLRLLTLVALGENCRAALILQTDRSYASAADSPFYAGIVAGTIQLEDFEDNLLNTSFLGPFVGEFAGGDSVENSPVGRILGPGRGPDFVDVRIEINFLPDATGHLPRYVGFSPRQAASATEKVIFSTFDQNGVLLDQYEEFQPIFSGLFVGFFQQDGISQLIIRPGGQPIDHLQYGYSIPEPSVALLVAATALVGFMRRRSGIHCGP